MTVVVLGEHVVFSPLKVKKHGWKFMVSYEDQTYLLLHDFSLHLGLKFTYSRNQFYCNELKCFIFLFSLYSLHWKIISDKGFRD